MIRRRQSPSLGGNGIVVDPSRGSPTLARTAKTKPREPITARLAGCLRQAGAKKRVMTIDLHVQPRSRAVGFPVLDHPGGDAQ